jgi:hypothetical protein
LAVLMFVIFLFGAWRLSQTADESTHLFSGYRIWKCGDFGVSDEHPPLAKLVAAFPLLAKGTPIACDVKVSKVGASEAAAALEWLHTQNARDLLLGARLAAAVFPLGLLLTVWFLARRMFGVPVAVSAAALVAFEPNVLAHGALVTTDVPVACCMTLAVACYYMWFRSRQKRYLVFTGLATGLTLAAKHSGIAVIPILLLLAVAETIWQRTDGRPWRRAAVRNLALLIAVFAIGWVLIWVVYGLRFTTWAYGAPEISVGGLTGSVLEMLLGLQAFPQAYLIGMGTALTLSTSTEPVFIWGHMYPQGQWFFFPLTITIKCTLAVLLLILAGAAGMALARRQSRREWIFLLLPACVFLAACSRATMNSGIRHALPALPFLLIFGAAGAVELAKRVRWGWYALGCLLVLHAASSLRVSPNFLNYSNELWGGPAKLYRYLPNSDWGEGYYQVKSYLQAHPARPCWILTVYKMDPAESGVPCDVVAFYNYRRDYHLTIPDRMAGTVIISSAYFDSSSRMPGGELDSFANLTPKAVIAGGSMLLFQGDFDTGGLMANARVLTAGQIFASGGRAMLPQAIQYLQSAIALSPANVTARTLLCFALARSEDSASAKPVCKEARSMMLNNPFDRDQLRELERLPAPLWE